MGMMTANKSLNVELENSMLSGVSTSRLPLYRSLLLIGLLLLGLLLSLAHASISIPTTSSSKAQQQLPISGMVVSTHPLYLIAQAVTNGIEHPKLLLPASQSGHDVQLHPADRQLLKQANFVLWFGAQYEAPLARVLKDQPNAIALFDLNAFRRLPIRNTQGQAFANSLDAHLWLDPVNAVAIAHAIAAVRAKQFPQFATHYKANAKIFTQQLMQAVKPFQVSRSPRPYWAYHDAYQYLERSLNLQFKGSLTVEHDLPPTLGQLAWLQQHRSNRQVGETAPKTMCLLAEGQIDSATLKRLQPLQLQVVDETMRGSNNFLEGWTTLAQAIVRCTQP